ncbi:hypothetical protein OIU85_017018 [Salix viminalis]|uniref:Uncharacterized protein n=1 Tax=Salix viminalis TaxID=40686 RepID=A0A9Q0ZQA4_SALVM|nr:hypothetical protein OIU85_017018 [Salix viminalis]
MSGMYANDCFVLHESHAQPIAQEEATMAVAFLGSGSPLRSLRCGRSGLALPDGSYLSPLVFHEFSLGSSSCVLVGPLGLSVLLLLSTQQPLVLKSAVDGRVLKADAGFGPIVLGLSTGYLCGFA